MPGASAPHPQKNAKKNRFRKKKGNGRRIKQRKTKSGTRRAYIVKKTEEENGSGKTASEGTTLLLSNSKLRKKTREVSLKQRKRPLCSS